MGKKIFTFMLCLLLPTIIFAAKNYGLSESNPKSTAMIQSALSDFAMTWNQGNINGVIKHYKEADTTTLIWSQLVRGYDNIESFLHKNYTSKDDMGTLSTSHVKIKLLSPRYALVTGDWLIKVNNNKETGGPFSMLYENTNQGWKIILDHGTSLPSSIN